MARSVDAYDTDDEEADGCCCGFEVVFRADNDADAEVDIDTEGVGLCVRYPPMAPPPCERDCECECEKEAWRAAPVPAPERLLKLEYEPSAGKEIDSRCD